MRSQGSLYPFSATPIPREHSADYAGMARGLFPGDMRCGYFWQVDGPFGKALAFPSKGKAQCRAERAFPYRRRGEFVFTNR